MIEGKAVPADEFFKELTNTLKIPASRTEEVNAILMKIMEDPNYEKVPDKLIGFIRETRKANEIAYLCFVLGIEIGGSSCAQMINEKMPGLIKTAAMMGAAMAQKEGSSEEAPPTQKPDNDPLPERMYG